MQGHISNLHCHYRIYGDRANTNAVENRLNSLVKQHVIDAYEYALDQVYGDEEQVIIIRRLQSNLFFSLDRDKNDTQLARQWGNKLAADVIKFVEMVPDGDQYIKRFNNQADYIADFIGHTLQGGQWDQWYFGSFRYLKHKNLNDTIYRLIHDNPKDAPAVLGRLQASGFLSTMLDRIDPTLSNTLWQILQGITSGNSNTIYQATGQEAVRLLSTLLAKRGITWSSGALDQSIVDSLERLLSVYTWLDVDFTRLLLLAYFSDQLEVSEYKPQQSTDIAASQQVETGKARELFNHLWLLLDRAQLWSPTAVSKDAMFSVSQPLTVINWQDSESLNKAFLEMLRSLHRHGYLNEYRAGLSPAVSRAIEQALQSLDWLDTDAIAKEFESPLNQVGPAKSSPSSQQLLTAKQKACATDLALVLRSVTIPQRLLLDTSSKALATYIYAALCERYSCWSGDAFALRLIDCLATVVSHYNNQPNRHGYAGYLGNLMQLTNQQQQSQDTLSNAAKLLTRYQDTTIPLLQNIQKEQDNTEALSFTTGCSGIFLLVRAINDLKLPLLVDKLDYPVKESQQSILLLIACIFFKISGIDRKDTVELDATLQWLLGFGFNQNIESIDQLWPDNITLQQNEAFQDALCNIVAGQRLLNSQELFIYEFCLEDGTYKTYQSPDNHSDDISNTKILLLAGDRDGNVWPIFHWLENDINQEREQFITRCKKITSASPELIVVNDKNSRDDCQQLYHSGIKVLSESMATLKTAKLENENANLISILTAMVVLRVWSRWLPKLSTSSISYLLNNFIRRSGELAIDEKNIVVKLEPAPLDVVIEMAGYLDKIENISWLGNKNITFSIKQ